MHSHIPPSLIYSIVALQVPYNGLESELETTGEKYSAADDYKQVKSLIGRINDLSNRMR